MAESESLRMERLTRKIRHTRQRLAIAARAVPLPPIDTVPNHRISLVRQMDTDLVRPTTMGLETQQRDPKRPLSCTLYPESILYLPLG